MYKCKSCGDEFERPEIEKERMPDYWGSPAYREYPVCPSCGGDIEEMYKCEICGNWTVNADWICDECMTTAKEAILKAVEHIECELSMPYNKAFYLAEDAMEALDG